LGDNRAMLCNVYRWSCTWKLFDCDLKLVSLSAGDFNLKESPALLVNIHMD